MVYIISILVVGLGVALDQYTKYLARTYLEKGNPVAIIDKVFELELTYNRGGLAGIFQGQLWLFLGVGVLVLITVCVIYTKIPRTKRMIPLRICTILITSGAIGNMIDRIIDKTGGVTDFFSFSLINFPIFNVADIFISVSIFVLAALLLFYYKDDEIDYLFRFFSFKKKTEQE